MRSFALLALILATAPAGLAGAQEAPVLSLASVDGAPHEPFATDGEVPTPARLVAQKVRDVLRDHADVNAWTDLSGALPELAIVGGADLESTFEAARLAETLGGRTMAPMSVASVTTPVSLEAGGITGLGTPRPDPSARWAPLGTLEWDLNLLAKGLAALAAIYALVMALFGGTRQARPARRSGKGVATSRHGEARALWAEGVPVHEIARRTGLARDAVAVIINRGGS